MIEIAGIDHIVLRVGDLARMERFYCDALGLKVAKRNEKLGLLHLRAGESLIDFIAVDGILGRLGGAAPGPEGRNVDHICLKVRDFDLDRVVAHLKAHGVEPGTRGPRFGAGGDGLSLYLTDPEGNGLELRSSFRNPQLHSLWHI
jgi:catechol 2,3-dioxygenase-like lactoylglutathione lyase family enzyme